MIRFQTVGGRAILISTRLADGSVVPFGASVFDAQGSEVGLAGQDGGIYLRGIAETGTLTARWGDAPDQKCSFRLPAASEAKGRWPLRPHRRLLRSRSAVAEHGERQRQDRSEQHHRTAVTMSRAMRWQQACSRRA